MKHLAPVHQNMLEAALREAGVSVGDSIQAQLLSYLDEIIERNASLNLTRIADPIAGVRLHLVDSLLALPEVAASPDGLLLDIGTGGGFPGVPLCVTSGRSGVLLDSVGKKARAVNQILTKLRLDSRIVAVHERAEEHACHKRGTYSVITVRAVSELPSLLELASPLLRPGGRLIALKGAPEEDELARGRLVASLVGMTEVDVRRVALPGGDERRCIVTYERHRKSPTRLPRRAGEAQRSPLA